MNYAQILKSISDKGYSVSEGDYKKDGLYYCHVCNEPKQCRVMLLGRETVLNCICRCRQNEIAAQEERDRKLARRERKLAMLQSEALLKCTLKNDDGSNPRLTTAMQRYCDHFDEFRKEGKGIMLYGSTGTGKTYAALEVFNELVDQGKRVYFSSVARIANEVQGTYDGKNEVIDRLRRYDLIILDDLSSERKTEYMQEIVYSVIDGIYKSKVPLIITTNLSAEELKGESDITFKRTYSRISEMCHPILVAGGDKRKSKARLEYTATKNILGL